MRNLVMWHCEGSCETRTVELNRVLLYGLDVLQVDATVSGSNAILA